MWITWLWYHVYQFHQRKGKWGILTFHNMIWNAATVVASTLYRMYWIVCEVNHWGEFMFEAWYYWIVYTKIAAKVVVSFTLFIHTYIRISFYSVLSDELKRGSNVSELCAYFCFPFSYIVSNSRTSGENTKITTILSLFIPFLWNMNSILRAYVNFK